MHFILCIPFLCIIIRQRSYIIQTAICIGSKNGLKVTVEDAKCMQASAYIPTTVFDDFELKEDVTFSINLNILVECLCMFWPTSQEDSITVQMFYKVTWILETLQHYIRLQHDIKKYIMAVSVLSIVLCRAQAIL